jgi:hypothetical protein
MTQGIALGFGWAELAAMLVALLIILSREKR